MNIPHSQRRGRHGIDGNRAPNIDYAQRLNAARVPSELIVVPGAFHGFDLPWSQAKISQWFNAAKLEALRRALGVSAA